MRPCGDSMKTSMPRLPRIAYSAAQPVSPDVAPRMLSVPPLARQHVLEQVAEELQRDVLERERRSVRHAQQVQARLQRAQRRDLVAAEDRRACTCGRRCACRSARRDVVDERATGSRSARSRIAERPQRVELARSRSADSARGTARPPSGARPSSRIARERLRVAAHAPRVADVTHQLQLFEPDAHDLAAHRRQRLDLRDRGDRRSSRS